MALSAGTRLGPYEILAPLGAGGMGEVYKANDTRLDRTVAIKVLPTELSADPQLRARFEREARAISALAHPNICTLYDVGEENGQSFLVMEHLVGQTLADRLKKGPLPLDKALAVATQIADALAAAHKQGIVHRDLKPRNVMLTETGARLLDFGLAKLVPRRSDTDSEISQTASWLTSEGVILGTVGYMSPEQASGKEVDYRSDQFSLGTVLYEALTGKRPFKRDSVAETLAAIIRDDPEPLRELVAGVPLPVQWIVERCLAKDASHRYHSTVDLAKDIRAARARVSQISTDRDLNDQASTEGRGVLDFKVVSVGRLPPPSRSPLMVGLVGGPLNYVVMILSCYLGFYVGSANVLRSERRFQVLPFELLDPASLMSKLGEEGYVVAAQIRAHLPAETRASIDEFRATESKEVSMWLTSKLRRELNRLVLSDRLLLDQGTVSKLTLPGELKEQVANGPEGDNLHLINRRLLERVCDGCIETYEPRRPSLLVEQFVSLFWSSSPILFVSLQILLLCALTYTAVLSYSLSTVRIVFEEVRDVDRLLGYFVSEMGFKEPVKEGDTLVFRAKLRTFLVWYILKLKARVDRNTVILTGATIMVRRFEKRIRAYAAG